MDINDFSDDNFDAVTFLNKTFEKSETLSAKENQVAQLVSKFQLYVQQVNSAIEDSSQQIFMNLPRVMKDAKNLQLAATTCRQKIHEIQSEISEVQKNTGVCMENLENLDSLTTKLFIAKQGLQESDGWGRSTNELEDFLEQNNVYEACNKLFALQKSLAVQKGLPGQAEREEQLEDFKNQIEALISPEVVTSFTSSDVEASKKYVDLFAKMERSPQLIQYYKTVQKRILQDYWSEATAEHFTMKFLREFYEILVDFWEKQTKWCVKVFSQDSSAEPTNIISELLISLQPSREVIINNLLKRSNDKLEILHEISTTNVFLGNSLQKHLQQLSTVRPEFKKLLSRAIFDYFTAYYDQYVHNEQTMLEQNLNELSCFQSSAAESVRNLDSANHKVLAWAQQSLKRCEDITQNCAFSSVFNVLNMFFKGFLEKYKKVQKQLDATLSATEEGWNLLPICIAFLQNIGELLMNFHQIDKNLCDIILTINNTINDPAQLFQYRITNSKDLNSLKKLIAMIKDSERDIQAQSSSRNMVVLGGLLTVMKPIVEESHDFTLALVFSPVEKYLESMEPPNGNDDSADLPDYSYAPQEYITQIGQYLLTLPQHLEPLLLTPSPALKIALTISDPKYESNSPGADVLLSLIAEETCALYQEKIFQITSISVTGAKQMAIDIEYLVNVMDELGLTMGRHLSQTAALLRAPSDKYVTLSNGCDPRLVACIRQMRNLSTVSAD